MNLRNLALAATILAVPFAALAQAPNPAFTYVQPGTNVAPGQTEGGMNQAVFTANSPTVGFDGYSLNPTVVALGTTQLTGLVLQASNNLITSCPTGAGVVLPAVQKYVPIKIFNRSGASCLVYPTLGAQVESALGTYAAANVPVTVANNSDTTFYPISATAWNQ